MLKNYRGRRLIACRARDALCDVINALGEDDGSELPMPDHPMPDAPSSAHKAELVIAANVLLRQILLWNDGH